MNLLYLSLVGNHYKNEEGQSGERLRALTGLESGLQKAILDRNKAAANLRNLHSKLNGTFRTLPVLGETAAQKAVRLQTDADDRERMRRLSGAEKAALAQPLEAALEKANQRIKRVTDWIQLQDATVEPDGSIDWTVSDRTVVYDKDAAAQKMTKLRFNGGKIYTDDAHSKPFDTTNMVTHFSGPGKAIYVMSHKGNIHVSSHSVGHRHHSSLLAGTATAGAGELEVKAGELAWISNKSGHYRPGLMHFLQALHVFEKKGIANSFRVQYHSSAGKKDFANSTLFQDSLQADGDDPDLLGLQDLFEFNKLMLYSAHLTEPILGSHAPNPWRWRDVTAGEKPAVYDAVTNTMVPYRDVRKWLKGRNLAMKAAVQKGVNR